MWLHFAAIARNLNSFVPLQTTNLHQAASYPPPCPAAIHRRSGQTGCGDQAAAGRRFNRSRVQCQTRLCTLKKRYKRELSKPPPSGWRYFSRLQAFLAGPPPGFPPKMQVSIKEEEEEEEEKCQEEVGRRGGLLGSSWTVPTRPRNGVAVFCPAVVVTKLAEVYERVELARLGVEEEKMAMEREKAVLEAVKVKEEKLDT